MVLPVPSIPVLQAVSSPVQTVVLEHLSASTSKALKAVMGASAVLNEVGLKRVLVPRSPIPIPVSAPTPSQGGECLGVVLRGTKIQ